MSSFVDVRYEMDTGDIALTRMRPVEAAVAGTPPTAAVTLGLHAYNTVSRRRFGVHTRGVRLKRVSGVAPDQRTRYAFLAVVTPADFDTPAYANNAVIAIDGVDWTVTSRVSELLV